MNDTFNSKGGEQNIAQGRNAIGKQENITQSVRGDGNIFSGTGNVIVNQGLSADDAVKLAKELAAGQLAAKDEQIKALTEAITALAKTGAPAANIQAAEQALQHGDTEKAKAIFAEVLKTKEAEGKQATKEAAAAARHLGALVYLHDTNGALAAYRKAVELDPDNAAGWNMLGHLFDRIGELVQAEDAYRNVLALGEIYQDKEWQAKAVGNLGNVAFARGELDKAEEMYRKALMLDETLSNKKGMVDRYGNLGIVYGERGELDKAETMFWKSLYISNTLELKESMANQYCNLGNVYCIRGELVNAEELYKKSLDLHEILGSKEGMAYGFGNLGIVYKQRGNLAEAEDMWKKSLRLYQEMNMPDAKDVQQWLDDLAQQRGR